MKTGYGIELDIKKSDYKVSKLNFTFYFSSKFYAQKFRNMFSEYIEMEQRKLYNKYKVKINAKLYLAVSLYNKIEKRGFYIVNEQTGNIIKPNVEFDEFII